MPFAPTFFFPTDNTQAKAVSLVPYASGLMVPMWPNNEFWLFNGVSLSVSGTIPSTGNSGFSGAASDDVGGVWLTQYTGSFAHYTSSGSAELHSLPGNEITTGCAFVPSINAVYTIGSGGQVYTPFASGVARIGSPLGQPAWGLVSSGTTLFTMLARTGQLGTLALSNNTAGVINLPAAISPTCLAASSPASSVCVGGFTESLISGNFTAFFTNPVAPYIASLIPSTNTVTLYNSTVWNVPTPFVAYAAVAHPTYGSWAPGGLHFAVTDPVSGFASIFTFIFGSAILRVDVPLPSAGPVAFVGPSNFLVAQPSSVVSLFASGSVAWAIANSVSLPGITGIIPTTPLAAVAGYVSGVAFLGISRSNQGVNISSRVNLPYTPTAVTSDVLGNAYSTGSNGASGYLSIFNGQILSSTLSWVGSGNAIAVFQDQIIVLDQSVPELRVFGLFQNIIQQIVSITSLPPDTSGGIAVTSTSQYGSGGLSFVYGVSGAWTYQFVSPYGMVNIPTGEVSIYRSSTWNTTSLGAGKVPSALTYDISGNVFVTTVQNDLFYISATGGVSGYALIPPYQNQLPGVALGLSSLAITGNFLYGASSLAGFLVQLESALGPPPPSIVKGLEATTGQFLRSTINNILLPAH